MSFREPGGGTPVADGSTRTTQARPSIMDAARDERQDVPGHYSRRDYRLRLHEGRAEAGAALAGELMRYRVHHPLVLGIVRGGLPIAHRVAAQLGAELDVIVARKIGAPGQSELAIGAVAGDGSSYLNASLIRSLRIVSTDLERAIVQQGSAARRCEQLFRASFTRIQPQGRTVILVDDGLATGATARACVRSVRSSECRQVVVATPVGSRAACAAVEEEVDALICLRRPEPFFAVGAHYESFARPSDYELLHLLNEYRTLRGAHDMVNPAS
jgi:putative phosphoribosyl transferase